MSDKLIKDRDGAGKVIINKLTNKVGTDGFRTAIIKDGDKTTMLRTKGGMPEVTVSKSVTSSCRLFPLVERDESGEDTQGARVYYHDHELDEDVPERRIYTSDGLFSIVAKPTRRVRFKSAGLGRPLDIWLNDHSVPDDEKNPLVTASFTQGGVTDEEKTNNVFKLAPVQCVEQLKRSPTATAESYKADELAFEDDSEARLWRRYYPPVFVNQGSPPEEGDDSALNGMAFLISRVKRMVFKVSGLGQHNGLYRAFFGRYNNNVTAEVAAGDAAGGLNERKISKRVFEGDVGNTPLMQKMEMMDGKISLSPPGGLFHPVRMDQWATLDPVERTRKADGSIEFLRLSSLSNVVTFGQPWHGLYSGITRTLRNIDTDEVIKTFDEADTSKDGVDSTLFYVNFGAEDLKLPANTVFSTDAEKDNVKFKGGAVFYNGRYSLLPGNVRYLRAGGLTGGMFQQFFVKNADGSVHKMQINSSLGGGVKLFSLGRFDTSFLDSAADVQTEIPFTYPSLSRYPSELNNTASEYGSTYIVRVSPDGRSIYTAGVVIQLIGDVGSSLSVSLKRAFTPVLDARGIEATPAKHDTFAPNGSPIMGWAYGGMYGDPYLPTSVSGGVGSWTYSSNLSVIAKNGPNGSDSWVEATGGFTCSISHTQTRREEIANPVSKLLDVLFDEASQKFVAVEVFSYTRVTETSTVNINESYSTGYDGPVEGWTPPPYLGPIGSIDSLTLRVSVSELVVDGATVATGSQASTYDVVPGAEASGDSVWLATHLHKVLWGVDGAWIGAFQYNENFAKNYRYKYSYFVAGGIVNGPENIDFASYQLGNYFGAALMCPQIYRETLVGVTNGEEVGSYAGSTIYHGKQSVTITPGQWVHIDPATDEIGVNNHQACVII